MRNMMRNVLGTMLCGATFSLIAGCAEDGTDTGDEPVAEARGAIAAGDGQWQPVTVQRGTNGAVEDASYVAGGTSIDPTLTNLYVGMRSTPREMLVKFHMADESGAPLPADSVIRDPKMVLYVNNGLTKTAANTIDVHACGAYWSETDDPNTPEDERKTGRGQFGDLLASFSGPVLNPAANYSIDVPLPVAAVHGWVADPAGNNGLLLKEQDPNASDHLRIPSSENSSAEDRPKLTFEYCLPAPEACDGIDNDCDGTVDDGASELGSPCSTGLLGACAAGTYTACSGGALTCTPTAQPGTEICNDGIDNDCDGLTDLADVAQCGCPTTPVIVNPNFDDGQQPPNWGNTGYQHIATFWASAGYRSWGANALMEWFRNAPSYNFSCHSGLYCLATQAGTNLSAPPPDYTHQGAHYVQRVTTTPGRYHRLTYYTHKDWHGCALESEFAPYSIKVRADLPPVIQEKAMHSGWMPREVTFFVADSFFDIIIDGVGINYPKGCGAIIDTMAVECSATPF